ncbi:MAG: hypothetical protein M1837_000216 [Sclerophora amabilis]|nr:MAG: hypothetical protein M1837_000216 [Sclerophora amabilis]
MPPPPSPPFPPSSQPDPNQLRHHPLVARPTRTLFDPWNSSSTGHQRAENRLGASTGWRDSRSAKLSAQLRGGRGGGRRVADQVGAGVATTPHRGKDGGWRTVKEMVAGETKPGVKVARAKRKEEEEEVVVKGKREGDEGAKESVEEPVQKKKGLFDGLVFYVNGSTAPLVSDHRLKYLIVENGGKVSIHLGRRRVTHVVLGRANKSSTGGAGHPESAGKGVSAGGGLAAGKIQKEVGRVGGCGVKYVGVEWVLGSIKSHKRLPEARFPGVHTAAARQKSVYGMFTAATKESKQ